MQVGMDTVDTGVDPGLLEKGVHMYNGWGIRFANFLSFFLKYPMKVKQFGLTETKLFHFHRRCKKGGGGGGEGVRFIHQPPLDPPP